MSDKSLLKKILRQFSANGLSGLFTMPFDEFSDETRTHVLSQATLAHNEIPGILCFLSRDKWSLIGTQFLHVFVNSKYYRLPSSGIQNVKINIEELKRPGASKKASELKELVVSLNNRAPIVLELEPGLPKSGFHAALLTFLRTSR